MGGQRRARPGGEAAGGEVADDGIGRFVRGTFDGVDSPCARDATGHVAARDSLIVVNKTGKVAGPYELGKAKHCPKAKKAKKTKAKHKKPASRSRAQS
jgi:hypothetical protein